MLFERQQDKRYSDMIENALKSLHEACLKSWNEKWFYRGWDGSGSPIGNESIFLEPLTWLLISRSLPDSYANRLIDSIYERLDKPFSLWSEPRVSTCAHNVELPRERMGCQRRDMVCNEFPAILGLQQI